MKCSKSPPLISVITVCFNSEQFIEQCIKSVVGQTFDDFEYIIIDGGSSDGTVEIIKQYEKSLSYFHSKPDNGIADAFNYGLKQSKGYWIIFLNSDDCFSHDNVLNNTASVLKENKYVDLVYGQVQIIKRQQGIHQLSDPVGDEWKWQSFNIRSTIPHPSSFTNRHFFEKVGEFDLNFRNALDYEMYLRAGRDLRTLFINEILAYMRDGGMSKGSAIRSYQESREAQIKNRTHSKLTAYVIYFAFFMRILIKRFLKEIGLLHSHPIKRV